MANSIADVRNKDREDNRSMFCDGGYFNSFLSEILFWGTSKLLLFSLEPGI
jgi:hypothetical protein